MTWESRLDSAVASARSADPHVEIEFGRELDPQDIGYLIHRGIMVEHLYLDVYRLRVDTCQVVRG